jgi:TfuA protein
MFGIKKDLFIFGGPSLELIPRAFLKDATLLPPVKRGDLEALIQGQKPSRCLIVDGLFGANMAVTPTECRQLLENGWIVCGCSSMGALRAADLWSLGMIGFGSIYNLFRLGYLKSDADVAVIYEKTASDTFQELTVSIVHILYLLKNLQKDKLIDPSQLNQMMRKAKQIFWVDRTWDALFEAWDKVDIKPNVLTSLHDLKHQPELHPKKLDAFEAMRLIRKFD